MKLFLHINAKKIETVISYFDNYLWNVGIQKNSEFLLISYHNSFFAFFGNQIACNISCSKNIGIKNIIPIIMHNISSVIEWFLIGWVKKL